MLDLRFKALADPIRRAILDRQVCGPASVSELAEPHPISLPAVFEHLKVLEQSGLIRSEKVGRVRTCQVDAAALGETEDWLSRRRTEWEGRLDRLGDYLDSKPKQKESEW